MAAARAGHGLVGAGAGRVWVRLTGRAMTRAQAVAALTPSSRPSARRSARTAGAPAPTGSRPSWGNCCWRAGSRCLSRSPARGPSATASPRSPAPALCRPRRAGVLEPRQEELLGYRRLARARGAVSAPVVEAMVRGVCRASWPAACPPPVSSDPTAAPPPSPWARCSSAAPPAGVATHRSGSTDHATVTWRASQVAPLRRALGSGQSPGA
jgi:hypothetical protein